MTNLVNQPPAKKNYEFIDAIRCIAMMSIVAEHSIVAGVEPFSSTSAKYYIFIGLVQCAKFGTIAFFLLAGFLISEKFADYSPGEYLKRRISTTFAPWLFWTFIYIIAMIISLRITDGIYHDGRFNLANILNGIKATYLHTSYWFIINFLISISILLIFRRYLYSLYLGGILMLFTLFYVVNIHFEWLYPIHSTAILGFVFFLWLGAQLRRYWSSIEIMASKIPFFLLGLFFVLTFCASFYETNLLYNKSVDPFNTLRISNIFFSLVVFSTLLKIKNFKFISYFKPRETTYGIYLIHYPILIFLLPEIFSHFNLNANILAIPQFLLFKASTFVITYSITFALVLGLSHSRLKKLIGN
jgi:hypothetical protein